MGTKVETENHLPWHHSIRDLNHESNGVDWPSSYNDVNLQNGECYNDFLPRTIADSHIGYDKDLVKQTMLKHEAIFKGQVYELHRLYQVQRDLMDEVRRKEQLQRRIPYETSSSSSPLPLHMQSKDTQRCNGSSFPFACPVFSRPFNSGPDNVQSSPNSAKGKSILAGPSPFQNCYSPKNSEVSESRPTKFRKLNLDLELPADEFIDTDEVQQFGRGKDFINLSSSPDEDRKPTFGNGRMFPSYPGKECQEDVARPGLHMSKYKGLADLNEPFHVDKTTALSPADFVGHVGSHRDVPYRDSTARLLTSSKDSLQNSKNGSLKVNGTSNNLQDVGGNGQNWFSKALKSEHIKASTKSINQGIVPSKSTHNLLDQASEPPAYLRSDHIKVEPWKLKPVGFTENSDRNYPLRNHNTTPPILAFHTASQSALFHPSDLGHSWDQSATSWVNPEFSGQKATSFQPNPFLFGLNLSKSHQLSAQSNAAFGSEPPVGNGFYQSSPAALKELAARFPPSSFDYAHCNSENNVPCNTKNSLNPVKVMNLNVALLNGVSDDYINPQGHQIIDKGCNPEGPSAVLPWLKGKGASNGSGNSRNGFNPLKSINSQSPRVLSSCVVKSESSQTIFGVSIFGNPHIPKDKNHNEEIECKKRKGFFDMNITCEGSDSEEEKMSVDEAVVLEKKETEPLSVNVRNNFSEKKETEPSSVNGRNNFLEKKETEPLSVNIRNNFDLNSCITEEEIPCGASIVYNSSSVKVGTGIDLEALINLENEKAALSVEDSSINEPEKRSDDGDGELLKLAASAIVTMSSYVNNPIQASMEETCPPMEAKDDDPLHWFMSIVCSRRVGPDGFPIGLDDLEYMILRQKECTPAEYFPEPSTPDFPFIENNTCVLTKTKTRKGQARRGRQKRDFQRDILPGLTTLSRLEVTEDLNSFGGILGSNRTRNGRGRGRRRLVMATPICDPPSKEPAEELHSNISEVGVEDRSLTGWGKTTRRPRRQRCPAGNHALPVALT